MRDLTDGGVDYSFEAIGLKTTAEQCYQMLRDGGTATIIDIIPEGTKIEWLKLDELVSQHMKVEQMKEAPADMKAGNVARSMIMFD